LHPSAEAGQASTRLDELRLVNDGDGLAVEGHSSLHRRRIRMPVSEIQGVDELESDAIA
jgi:hypothetical protein